MPKGGSERQPATLSVWERFPALKEIPESAFPQHVLIIPDGNRRFARNLNEDSIFGHRKGVEVLQTILRDLRELPIQTVTVWGFSADNWKRPQEEVEGLMFLFEQALKENLPEFMQYHTRFVHLGRNDRLTPSLQETIRNAELETAENKGQTLCLAIGFGGEDQTIRMVEKARLIPFDQPITKEVVERLRDGDGTITPADLIIRTSGEMRISDIGWLNGANTELYSSKKLFPEMTTEDIIDALVDFSKRQRRLGT